MNESLGETKMETLKNIRDNLLADYDATTALEKLARLGYEPCLICINGLWAAPPVVALTVTVPKDSTGLMEVSFHINKKEMYNSITIALIELIEYYIKLDGDE